MIDSTLAKNRNFYFHATGDKFAFLYRGIKDRDHTKQCFQTR
jgi:hypothetical protein